jgi:hypothetical protein
MTDYKPVEQFDITYDRDTERRHSWHISRAGKVIGRVWLDVNRSQWTSGDGWLYRSRIAAALALASDTPMEG